MQTEFILYDVADHVATITLNRPEAANAQNMPLLDDLDEAWTMAADDPEVKVIVLQANGKHFSSGHDLRERDGQARHDHGRDDHEDGQDDEVRVRAAAGAEREDLVG